MDPDSVTQQYEQAQALAEEGRHQEALEQIKKHLQQNPHDGRALNDAGTLLFCMQRGQEAMVYFEKAMMLCQGDDRVQVYWNLCETYLQEGYPEKAQALFGKMQQAEILNIDTLNRTADVFLKKHQLGQAIETMMHSLKLSSEQQVLKPMIEVIRSNRKKAVVVSDAQSYTAQMLAEHLDARLPTQYWTADQADVPSAAQIWVFVGIGTALQNHLQCGELEHTILVMDEQDLASPILGQVDFSKIDELVVCADSEVVECISSQAPSLTVVAAESVPDPEMVPFYEKDCGKRIAAVGPWSARTNPMFLLQCFQKLHYLDSEYRLYLAGHFEDPTLHRYLVQMIDAMNLENVVFLDGPVKNLSAWFKDKHYIVSTAIDASALGGFWHGMACGLSPVAHRFAGIEEMFNGEFSFDLAEDFCRLIQKGHFDPASSRQQSKERFIDRGLGTTVHRMICIQEANTPMSGVPLEKNIKDIEQPGQSSCHSPVPSFCQVQSE